MAEKSRKAAKNAAFHSNICQKLVVSFKILTQFQTPQPEQRLGETLYGIQVLIRNPIQSALYTKV
ncbi:MAG: hypothetical protein KME25_26795 [Symplocastrum torsivum CPER-KK1]|uniref:Uncharacterized protein n=1 Tax=Symplocastrum torsivum CPER-KK1 TaxID=450513 RepID=A0A951PQH4_9CYAN|nr:hypothetical protein [Microcoleus sp. FACHB-SPT15]MBD1809225.1 hypothetical protein [Microcoleus sp. FACHB-SPT15]MBW4548017.1 hypothetical protein [Symplocastrum torsivum CPER-KK1]